MTDEEGISSESSATPKTIDFTNVPISLTGDDSVLVDDRPYNDSGHVMTRKQIRTRVRRALKKGRRPDPADAAALFKPIEDWDMEELAKGRPRAIDGTFSGRPPQFVTRELHELAMDRFKGMVKAGMRHQTITALDVVTQILMSEEVDHRGKPIVPASTKLDAAKFLIEHQVGKAVQPIQADVSVKLQALLGVAMVNPDANSDTGYSMPHMGTRGMAVIEGEVIDDQIDPEDDDDGE
jgi:hypothetical protein